MDVVPVGWDTGNDSDSEVLGRCDSPVTLKLKSEALLNMASTKVRFLFPQVEPILQAL